jgi:endonuclease/exonuclease/phosphatase family metal-dependent hydrolase
MKVLSFLLLLTGIGLVFFLKWAAQSDITPGYRKGPIKNNEVNDMAFFDQLRIMTWNIGYGYGLGSEGSSYTQLSRDEYMKKLNHMASVIKKYDPDILLIQEIDFDSKRSGHLNQVEFLSRNTQLKNFAYLSSWTANYIPFPYTPISDHFGKMNSGGVVMTKFTINEHIGLVHKKPANNPWWYNMFYLHRYTQMVKIGPIRVFNNHLEAFDKENRQEQVKEITQWIDRFKRDLVVFGGDLNTLPYWELMRANFEGYPEDDYSNDSSHLYIKNRIPWMSDSVDKEVYNSKRSDWLTFPSNRPDRKLDYLFVGKKLKVVKKMVIKNTLSDHMPLVIDVQSANAND